jgi:L-threonylcarbamoyladenylate synthase
VGALLSTVDDAVAIVERGGVVVIPTETVYGLAVRPTEAGVARIFDIKGRAADKSLQMLVPDVSWLEVLARPSDDARTLASAFWPGPLTLVLPASDDAPAAVVRDDTVGLRQPAHPLALELLAKTGPLAASSANRSGETPAPTVAQIREVFGDRVDGYLDGGYIDGAASTVIAMLDRAPTFLRVGALSEADVKSALAGGFEVG